MKKLLILLAIIIVVVLLVGCNANEPTDWAEYVVQSGDTVCDIATSIKPDYMDYRKTEYDIITKNNIKQAIIHPGHTILVPVYE